LYIDFKFLMFENRKSQIKRRKSQIASRL